MMETENKEIKKMTNLTDEELKEVAGGAAGYLPAGCARYLKSEECIKKSACRWSNGKCIYKYA